MKDEKNVTYVQNKKISSRQTLRLYVFDLMGIATLLLPPYLAKLCGANGIYAILLGTGIGLVYLFYLGWIMKKMEMDMVSYLQNEVPGWLGKTVIGWVMLHSVFTAGFCAYVFANLMQYSLVKEISYLAILLLIVLGAVYAVSGGIESRARVYEVLFWFILIPYIAMMLAAGKDIKWAYVEPILRPQSDNLLRGMYLVFLLLSPLFFSLFLIGEKEKNYGRNIIKTIGVSVLFSGSILLGSFVLLLGNFGTNALAKLRFPVVTLMSTIQFEGNFLKRMDALMLAVWFFTLYALLNLHLHYGVQMLATLFQKRGNKRRWWQLVLPFAMVFVIAYGMHSEANFVNFFLKYYSYGAIPCMVLFPVALLCFKRRKCV